MTDTRNGSAPHADEDTRNKAAGILADHMAEGLAAIERNKVLENGIHRAETLCAVAEEQVRSIRASLAEANGRGDFFMRYATKVMERMDAMEVATHKAMEDTADHARVFDEIARLAQGRAEHAHSAYLALSTLVTTIGQTKADARDAAYQPRIEKSAADVAERAAKAVEMAVVEGASGTAGSGGPAVPSFLLKGPRVS